MILKQFIYELQEYLRTFGLEKLQEEFHIKARFGIEFPELVCLNYNQIKTPYGEKLTWACRGIIFNTQDWSIISAPYTRFFNYGEHYASQIDWESAQVYEKLDGSLAVLYFYKDAWRVQSRGTVEGEGNVNGLPDMTFKQLFWETWDSLGYVLPSQEEYKKSFMFELMTPLNRVVVQHHTSQIALHGIRHIDTLEEEKSCKKYGWECATMYPLQTVEQLVEMTQHLDPMTSEGFVVVDSNFNRIKIKNPSYVAISHMIGAEMRLSLRSLLTIIQKNESQEWLSYYPEWKNVFSFVSQRIQKLHTILQIDWDSLQRVISYERKEFAQEAKQMTYPGVMFTLYDKKVSSVEEYLQQLTVKQLEKMLHISSEEVSQYF